MSHPTWDMDDYLATPEQLFGSCLCRRPIYVVYGRRFHDAYVGTQGFDSCCCASVAAILKQLGKRRAAER